MRILSTQPSQLWPASSNLLFEQFCKEYGSYYPEELSSYGLGQFDNRTLYLDVDQEEVEKSLINRWKKIIKKHQEISEEPELIIDLNAFLSFLSRKEAHIRATQDHQIIPFFQPSAFIHDSVIPLLGENKLITARSRLASYLIGNCDEPNLFEMHKQRVLSLIGKYKNPLYPYHRQVKKYIETSPYYLENIKRHFIATGFQGWEEVFKRLTEAIADYQDFIEKHILPSSRMDTQLNPLDWYISALATHGIGDDPKILVDTAASDFDPLLTRWRRLSSNIASKYNLSDQDPVSVFSYFRNLASKDPKEICRIYEKARKEVDSILQSTHFYHLPSNSRFVVRIGSTLESLTIPYPDLRVPKLLNKNPQEIEFVLPDPRLDDVGDEDYCLPAALSLLVHEGWPGHAYHIQWFQEHTFSDIRKSFLFSSALAEGWAVYGEWTLLEYLPIEAQFITLQTLIWRCCRMIIEPQLYMRKISPGQAMEFLQQTVGLSAATAATEIDRYTFIMPGQAPCYYYGYKKISDFQGQRKALMQEEFSAPSFHKELIEQELYRLFF
ncbi:MAG: hypothetical protein BGO28_05400 [Alphaproteobacteria bacterium 43-37]|nr:MAG: hypothetical protein BGO28_05400 [Alphaproteobacteria bacterium 43-37]